MSLLVNKPIETHLSLAKITILICRRNTLKIVRMDGYRGRREIIYGYFIQGRHTIIRPGFLLTAITEILPGQTIPTLIMTVFLQENKEPTDIQFIPGKL